MRISKLQVKNFRNFRHLEIHPADDLVIVGENKVGKSNLLHALRLVLDPSLPDSARLLELSDFYDGCDPSEGGTYIEVDVEIDGFAGNAPLMALLGGYLIQGRPPVARLTYQFRAIADLNRAPSAQEDFEFTLFGAGDPSRPIRTSELRRRMPLNLLPAMRDAEADLARWTRSPLRPLVQRATADAEALGPLTKRLNEAQLEIANTKDLKDLAQRIHNQLVEMVGPDQAVGLTIGLTPTDLAQVLRSFRLFIDEGRRPLSDASLGTTNLLYMALRELANSDAAASLDPAFVFTAIEEPEAHLHPQVQRLVYKHLLRPAPEGTERREMMFLTTHSPNVVSVSPLNSVVLLRRDNAGTAGATVAKGIAGLTLDDRDRKDIERYLDVTRAEILFSKGVIFVEGEAERFLVPAFAKAKGIDLDRLGLSVCAIGGTHFGPYVRVFGPEGFDLPVTVVTDLDPPAKLGIPRLRMLLAATGVTAPADEGELRALGKTRGFFVNASTLETELCEAGPVAILAETLEWLALTRPMKERAISWRESGRVADGEFMADVAAIGKGRFAQALAERAAEMVCPPYLVEAIEYAKGSVSGFPG